MYYICKFSESWSIYDGKKGSSRLLEKSEVETIKTLFPALLQEAGQILTAIEVATIQPNKLMKLSAAGNNGKAKKMPDLSPKS